MRPAALYKKNMYEGMPPERITLALFEGALLAIDRAHKASEDGVISTRGEQIGKALAIVGELNMSLKMDVGGELALNLRSLYEYSTFELLEANRTNNREKMMQVRKVLKELRDGWAQMCDEVAKNRTTVPMSATPKLASGGGYM